MTPIKIPRRRKVREQTPEAKRLQELLDKCPEDQTIKTVPFAVLFPNFSNLLKPTAVVIDITVRYEAEIDDWVLTEEAHKLIDQTKRKHV